MLAVIEGMGLSGIFSSFLRASFSTTSSWVLVTGIPTRKIIITRSVGEGCPLSPLLFIVAINVLSAMFHQAVVNRSICGDSFPGAGVQSLLNMYAYDVSIVVRAHMTSIDIVQLLLKTFFCLENPKGHCWRLLGLHQGCYVTGRRWWQLQIQKRPHQPFGCYPGNGKVRPLPLSY